jgi:3-oxoacyl-[acyl-carrier protein] reductase
MKLLEGKTALITGASRGIGKAIALAFARQGADIAFSDLNRDENMELVEKEVAALSVKVKGYASDASSLSDSEKLVEDVLVDFGGIDILVNNAGITRDGLLMRMEEKDWDIIMAVNLKSVFNLTKAVQRSMLKQRSGSIINMSSVVGVSGNAGQSNYSASKAGIIGFTKSIAKELGSRSIRCNAIAPGFIETEMTAALDDEVRATWIKDIPLKRGGTPDDVADLCVFLGSDLSSYITGQVVNVCGGLNL